MVVRCYINSQAYPLHLAQIREPYFGAAFDGGHTTPENGNAPSRFLCRGLIHVVSKTVCASEHQESHQEPWRQQSQWEESAEFCAEELFCGAAGGAVHVGRQRTGQRRFDGHAEYFG